MRSRKPGAKRSICAVIASFWCAGEPRGHVGVRPERRACPRARGSGRRRRAARPARRGSRCAGPGRRRARPPRSRRACLRRGGCRRGRAPGRSTGRGRRARSRPWRLRCRSGSSSSARRVARREADRPASASSARGVRSSSTAFAGGSCASEVTSTPVSIVPPWATEVVGHRVDDGLAAADRHGPAAGVRVGAERERRGGRRRGSASGGSRAPRRPRASPAPTSSLKRRFHSGDALLEHAQAEAERAPPGRSGRQQRVVGEARDAVGALGERPHQRAPGAPSRPSPPAVRSSVAVGDARPAAVERVRVRDLGDAQVDPPVELEAAEELGRERHRVHRRADVVVEPGQRQLRRARTAAGCRCARAPATAARRGPG